MKSRLYAKHVFGRLVDEACGTIGQNTMVGLENSRFVFEEYSLLLSKLDDKLTVTFSDSRMQGDMGKVVYILNTSTIHYVKNARLLFPFVTRIFKCVVHSVHI